MGGTNKTFGAHLTLKDDVSPGLEKLQQKATQAADQSEKAFEGLGQELDNVKAKLQGLEASQAKFAQGGGVKHAQDWTNALQGMQQGFGQLEQGIDAFAQRSSQLTTVGTAFRNIAKDAGASADGILAQMSRATKGTVDDLELMRQANTAVFLSGKEILSQLPDLFKVAQASAKATGQSVEFLTNSLVTGIGRESKLILDNLGMTIQLEKVHAQYAETLGKTVEQLTDAERKQALINEVLRQGQTIIAAVGGETKTLGEEVEATRVFLRNMGDEVIKFASAGAGSMGSFVGTIGAVSGGLSDASGFLLSVNSLMALGGKAAVGWGTAFTVAAGGVVHIIRDLKDDFSALPGLIEEVKKAAERHMPEASGYFEKFGQWVKDTVVNSVPLVGTAVRTYEGWKDTTQGLGIAFEGARVALHMLSGETRASAAAAAKAADAEKQLMHAAMARMAFAGAKAEKPTQEKKKDWREEAEEARKEYDKGVKDREQALKEQERQTKEFVSAVKGHLKDLGAAQREQWKEELDGLKERGEALKDSISDYSQWRKGVEDAWDSFGKKRAEQTPQFEEDMLRLGKILSSAKTDSGEAKAAIGEFADVWGMDLKDAIGLADQAIQKFKESGKDSLEEVKRQTAEAGKMLEEAAGKAGLFSFKLSEFRLSEFGAGARQHEAEREARKLNPLAEQFQNPLDPLVQVGVNEGFQGPGRGGFGGDFFGANDVPMDIHAMVLEYEDLQLEIEDVELALKRQPKVIDELGDAFDRTYGIVSVTTDELARATAELAFQSDTVQQTLEPLADARTEFNLAGASIRDVGRAIVPMGNAAHNLSEGMEGAAVAVGDFATAIAADSGLVTNLGTIGENFTTAGEGAATFRGYFDNPTTGLNVVMGRTRDLLGTGTSSLGAALTTFNASIREKLFGITQSGDAQTQAESFRQYFRDLTTDTATLIQDLNTDVGGGLNSLASGFGDFNADSRVTVFAQKIGDIAASANLLKTSIAGMGSVSGDLGGMATHFGAIGPSATTADTAFRNMSGSTGSVETLKSALNSLGATGALTSFNSAVTAIEGQLWRLGRSDNSTGATYQTKTAVEALRDRIGPSGTPGTLATELSDLGSNTNGPLGTVVTALGGAGGMKEALATLGSTSTSQTGSVAAMADKVGDLTVALNQVTASRTSSRSQIDYPTTPNAFGNEAWDQIGAFMDPAIGYKSRNVLQERWGTLDPTMGLAADDLTDWWHVASGNRRSPMHLGGASGSTAAAVQTSPINLGGDAPILINLGGVHIHAAGQNRADIEQAAERAAEIIGQRLHAKLGGRARRR